MEQSKKIISIVAIAVVVVVLIASLTMNAPSSDGGQEITVFAAASLTAAFTDLADEFEATYDIHVNLNFAGSSTLKTQILNGASADVFASANEKNMDGVAVEGMMDNSSIQTFAMNKLVVILPADNPAGITSLADIVGPDIKIVIGDEEVPFGNYTRTVLMALTNSSAEYADYYDLVMDNVISMESSVTNAVNKVVIGEADAAFVYTTDAASAGSEVLEIEIPDEYNVIATYPIGMVADTESPSEAMEFINFVMSEEGQAILAEYGFVNVI